MRIAFLLFMALGALLSVERHGIAMGGGFFGTYSPAYLARQEMKRRCATGERYDLMRKAYENQLPNPCDPKAKVWVK